MVHMTCCGTRYNTVPESMNHKCPTKRPNINVIEILESVSLMAETKYNYICGILNQLTTEDPEWDALTQVRKDLREFIDNQTWTLSLVKNGQI